MRIDGTHGFDLVVLQGVPIPNQDDGCQIVKGELALRFCLVPLEKVMDRMFIGANRMGGTVIIREICSPSNEGFSRYT